MEVLRQLVQIIIIIVILTVFLEMLLPRSDMRRYIRMVMGLLVIIAVLQNITALVNKDFFSGIPGVIDRVNYEPVSLDKVMAAGKSLAEKNNQEAVQKYGEGLAKQVLSLANMNSEVKAVNAVVHVDENTTGISKITIVFTPAGGNDTAAEDFTGDRAVQPVIVETGFQTATTGYPVEPSEADIKAASKVASLVADFYNLSKDRVEIKFQ